MRDQSGLEKIEYPLFDCIGTYVVLDSLSGGRFSVGQLQKITAEHYILNPYQGVRCIEEKGWVEAALERNEFVPRYNTRIRTITKEDFENGIILTNKIRDKEDKQDQSKSQIIY